MAVLGEAYGLAALCGLPLGDALAWCELVSKLADDASVESLSGPDAAHAIAEVAVARASSIEIGDERAGLELTHLWLQEQGQRSDVSWTKLQVTESDLITTFEVAREILSDLGLLVPASTHFEIVDEFPEPFHKRTWSAFCPDPVDEQRFGIPAGIYLRRDRLKPIRSATLISHELCHVVPGLTGGDYLAMGLEEGIAEILGNIIVGGEIVTPSAADNDFTFTLLGDRPSPASAYLDHTRQAYRIYEQAGTDGLVNLLREGRPAIRQAEMALINGRAPITNGAPSTGDENRRVARLVLGSLRSLIVSPLEYRVASVANSGMTVGDVAREVGVSKDVAAEVLETLSDKTAMVLLSKDIVEFSNFELYRDSGIGSAPIGLRVVFGPSN